MKKNKTRKMVSLIVELIVDVVTEHLSDALYDDDLEDLDWEDDLGEEPEGPPLMEAVGVPKPDERTSWRGTSWRALAFKIDGKKDAIVASLPIPAFSTESANTTLVISAVPWANLKMDKLRAVIGVDPVLMGAANKAGLQIAHTQQPEHPLRPTIFISSLRSEDSLDALPGKVALIDQTTIDLIDRGLVMKYGSAEMSIELSVFGFVPDEVLLSVPEENRKVIVSLSLGFDVVDDTISKVGFGG